MVAVDPFYMVFFEDFGVFLPALAFNPLTALQTALLGGLTLAAMFGG